MSIITDSVSTEPPPKAWLLSYKAWLVVAVATFGMGLLSGFMFPVNLSDLLDQDLNALKDLGSMLPPFSITTAVFIFLKNSLALLVSFALSPLLCLVPLLTLILNGWVISLISVEVVRQQSLGYLLTGILPHGILEIPAFILGEVAALSFGSWLILALFRKDNRAQLRPAVQRSLKYLLVAIMLFLPAAIIETYLTPWLLG